MLKQNLDETIKRFESFQKKDGVKALIKVTSVADINGEVQNLKPLNQYNFPKDTFDYLDAVMNRQELIFNKRLDILDDYIPAINPFYGIAEHCAFLGGKVEFGEDTSYAHRIIEKWEDLDTIEFNPNNEWFLMVMNGLSYLKEKSNGHFLVKLRGCGSPTELAMFLRGNDLFTDFYEYPEETKKLLELCLKLNKYYIDGQLKAVDEFNGGIIDGTDTWLLGKSFGHMTEDWSVMCSTETYNEFGKPYTQRQVLEFDNVLMHTHTVGEHIIPEIASIKQITNIQISSDPNAKRAIEIYKKHSQCLEGKTVTLTMTKEEIINNLEFLNNKKTIIHYEANTKIDAEYITNFVKKELN